MKPKYYHQRLRKLQDDLLDFQQALLDEVKNSSRNEDLYGEVLKKVDAVTDVLAEGVLLLLPHSETRKQ